MKLKKLLGMPLLAILLTLAMTAPCSALSNTTLHTVVPDSITLEIFLHGKGRISINGTVVAGSCEISIPRLEDTEIRLLPDSQNVPLSVILNGNQILSEFFGNSCVIQSPGLDASLEISFSNYPIPFPENPKTGDYGFMYASTVFSFSASMIVFITIIYVKRRRKQ